MYVGIKLKSLLNEESKKLKWRFLAQRIKKKPKPLKLYV